MVKKEEKKSPVNQNGKKKTKRDMTFASVSMDRVGDYFEFRIRVSEEFFSSGLVEKLLTAGSSFAGGLIGRSINQYADIKHERALEKEQQDEELVKPAAEPVKPEPEPKPG